MGLSFDGNDYVTVADSDTLRLSAGMTLEARVKPSSTSSTPRYALAKTRSSGGFDYALAASDAGAASGTVRTANQYVAARCDQRPAVRAPAGVLYHGTDLRVYIDGVLASSRSVSGSIAASGGALRIGNSFKGVIDDVRVYDGALSVEAIRADSNVSGALAQLTALRSSATTKATHRQHEKATKRHRQHKKATHRHKQHKKATHRR